MIVLSMHPEEIQTLLNLIDTQISDLYVEIRHTDNAEYKQILKHREKILKRISDRLQMSQATFAAP